MCLQLEKHEVLVSSDFIITLSPPDVVYFQKSCTSRKLGRLLEGGEPGQAGGLAGQHEARHHLVHLGDVWSSLVFLCLELVRVPAPLVWSESGEDIIRGLNARQLVGRTVARLHLPLTVTDKTARPFRGVLQVRNHWRWVQGCYNLRNMSCWY